MTGQNRDEVVELPSNRYFALGYRSSSSAPSGMDSLNEEDTADTLSSQDQGRVSEYKQEAAADDEGDNNGNNNNNGAFPIFTVDDLLSLSCRRRRCCCHLPFLRRELIMQLSVKINTHMVKFN
mmetsp:Transcript_31466/g.33819  ORF Transcript_31466/g.33819 Transcript_31466/m.33819 type:complete len:123 (+) Transcript_31466:77-445(+)